MNIRRIVFWSHLVTGVTAGIVILCLSITGVLLTYERQITGLMERNLFTLPASPQLSVDELLIKARLAAEKSANPSLQFAANPNSPVTVTAGRTNIGLMNPYDGEMLQIGPNKTQAVFHWITEFHRWFAVDRASHSSAKAITGVANLMFLFLLISGAWLWLPKVYKWAMFRARLILRRQPNSKARDFHWHHVFAAWSFIPLLVIILTATVFSYTWSNSLVYSAFGETAPIRKGIGPGQGASGGEKVSRSQSPGTTVVTLQTLYDKAKSHNQDWNSVQISAPKSPIADVRFLVDTGNGGQPTKKTTLVYSRVSGELVSEETFSDRSPASQARFYIRFLHTGEALGIIGQTVAGIASLFACILVYTGLALAYGRLIRPLFAIGHPQH